MPATPVEPLVYSLASTVSRFSSYFYQCYIIPLALAVILLRLSTDAKPRPVRDAVVTLGVCAAAAGLYFLIAPLLGDFVKIGNVAHVALLAILILYVCFLKPMQPHVKIVMTSAIIADINFALSISTQVLMPAFSLSVSNLLQFLLLAGELAVVYLFRPSRSERIPTAYWLSMLLIAGLSSACLYAIRTLGGRVLPGVTGNYAITAVILFAFCAVNLLIYYLYYVIDREHRSLSDVRAIQAKLAQDLEFYRRSDTLTQDYSALRHELKNHIALMQSLLNEEKYDELRRYFADYAGKITPKLAEFHCPNAVVSSVITHQMNTALAAGVTLDVIAAVPETLGVRDDDLCSILSNMIDNGVEGCLRAGRPIVRASLHTDRDCLFISVTNPADTSLLRDNPDLLTTKENAAGHGFGIPIIRGIAEKYDGYASFHVRDGWFIADAMLYMEG